MAGNARITLKDIAEAAGLSKSAVSLALRNHPSLPESTRTRVRLLAEEMGYRPDPALSALSSYRHAKYTGVVETLAWVTRWPTIDAWKHDSPVYGRYYVGACRRAEQLGYRMEHFWMREPGVTRARFEQILRTRSIRGLVLAPQPVPHASIELTWPRYAAVTIGFSISRPSINMVTCSHFRSMITVFKQLRRHGYRRIGCALSSEVDARVEHAWLAAFLVEQQRHDEDLAIPPLLVRMSQHRRFRTWVKTHRPDAVITAGPRQADRMQEWCSDLRLTIPDDIGLAVVSNVPSGGELSGIHELSEGIGAVAVDVLTGMLHRNELGLPDLPRRTMIDGEWVEGKTVRFQRTQPPKTSPTKKRRTEALIRNEAGPEPEGE